jgi:alkylation response protein AidB-like acyl-CoA dehydrogenase
VADAIARSGTPAQRQRLLPDLVNGDAVAAWCLGAPVAGISTGGGRVDAVPQGESFVLDGATGPVEAGGQADHYLLTTGSDGGVTQFMVGADVPGVTIVPAHGLDLVRRFAQVRFDRVAVPRDAVLGVPGRAGADAERQLQVAAVLQVAEMVGALDRAFEFTVEYAFDRYSFGRPLASYQALKHRFADLKTWLEASQATATAAARAVDSGSPSAPELVSVAKSYVGERGPAILQDCVQLHGGIGVTWDHDLHLYLRRVVTDSTQWGTPADHRQRVAVAMGM